MSYGFRIRIPAFVEIDVEAETPEGKKEIRDMVKLLSGYGEGLSLAQPIIDGHQGRLHVGRTFKVLKKFEVAE